MPVDPRLGTFDEHELVQEMFQKWVSGMPKSHLEERYLGTSQAHGKRFSNMVKSHLDIETERRHPMAAENERLRELLRSHCIDPDGN